VDQGEEEFSVEEAVEEMREDRRRRNDKYQFATYHAKMLQNGEGSFNGEWTTYHTTTFFRDVNSLAWSGCGGNLSSY
jgi:hypothetical protein